MALQTSRERPRIFQEAGSFLEDSSAHSKKGTIHRAYFAPVNGRPGQTADNQIDCLADLGAAPGKIEAAYEATILVGILNARATGNNRCYLTLLGGSAFGNAGAWILDAIRRALAGYAWAGLDVAIVSYGRSSGAVRGLVGEI